jgi:hypothetical protein
LLGVCAHAVCHLFANLIRPEPCYPRLPRLPLPRYPHRRRLLRAPPPGAGKRAAGDGDAQITLQPQYQRRELDPAPQLGKSAGCARAEGTLDGEGRVLATEGW